MCIKCNLTTAELVCLRCERAMVWQEREEKKRINDMFKNLTSPAPVVGLLEVAKEPVLIRSKPKKSFWEESLEDRFPSLRF